MIEREERDGILTLRLAHGKANALDVELVERIAAFLRDDETRKARGIIVTASGNIFSAGVDLPRLVGEGRPYVERFLPPLTEMYRACLDLPMPTVAAVNGHAIAGGCLLALSCDRRIMAEGKGRIGVPELQVGVPFPALALEIARAAVPPHYLREVILRGRTFLPDDALKRGLVDEIVPAEELQERAMKAALELAAIPREAYRIAKQQLLLPLLESYERTARALENEANAVWKDEATMTHIRGYLERTVGRKT